MRLRASLIVLALCACRPADAFANDAATGSISARGELLPEIRAVLGQKYKEVEERSSVSIQFRGGDDFMQFHALKPHRFIYQHPRLGFVLPEAKGVSMAAVAGRIEQIDVNPQLTYLVLDDAIERCRKIVHLLDKKGWKRDRRRFKNLYSGDTLKHYGSLESVRDAFLDPSLDQGFSRVLIASWKNNLEEAEVALARWRGQETPPVDRSNEARYLISVTLGYAVTPPPWVSRRRHKLP